MTDKEENGEACGKETGEESKKAENRFRSGTFLHILFLFKYCLPLLCGITLVVSGAFHSVRALQRGVQLLISPLRLSFETLREARAAIGSSESGHQIYFVLATGVILCFLFFCIGLFFAVLSAVCGSGCFISLFSPIGFWPRSMSAFSWRPRCIPRFLLLSVPGCSRWTAPLRCISGLICRCF